jgi:hypothetical protein
MTDDDPLERLFVETDDDTRVVAEHEDVDETEFRAALLALADAAETANILVDDFGSLTRTGLRQSDLEALIFGRNNKLNKTEIARGFEALHEVAEASPATRERYFYILLSKLSGLTMAETQEFVDELRELRDRYPPEEA